MEKSSQIQRSIPMVSSFLEWLWKLFTLLLVLSGCAVISKSESFLSGRDLNLNCSLVSNRVMLDVTITIDANKAKADLSERNTRTGTHKCGKICRLYLWRTASLSADRQYRIY